MRHVATLLLASTALALLSRSARAVVNGQVDTTNQYSNVCAIVLVIPPASEPDLPVPALLCSGTLIAPRVVLTAGHCSAFFEQAGADGDGTLDNLRISFGVDAFDPSTWLELDAIVTHPDFSAPTWNMEADIGAIILSDPVVTAEPATLPAPGMLTDLKAAGDLQAGPNGSTFTLVGYGRFDPAIPPDGLRRFAQTGFTALTPAWVVTNENPAFGFGGGQKLDSGAASFYVGSDGTTTLAGSHNDSTNDLVDFHGQSAVGWAMRLDAPLMTNFIADVIASVEP
jgi:hypothetical protein